MNMWWISGASYKLMASWLKGLAMHLWWKEKKRGGGGGGGGAGNTIWLPQKHQSSHYYLFKNSSIVTFILSRAAILWSVFGRRHRSPVCRATTSPQWYQETSLRHSPLPFATCWFPTRISLTLATVLWARLPSSPIAFIPAMRVLFTDRLTACQLRSVPSSNRKWRKCWAKA